jgi:hypothetical protein
MHNTANYGNEKHKQIGRRMYAVDIDYTYITHSAAVMRCAVCRKILSYVINVSSLG